MLKIGNIYFKPTDNVLIRDECTVAIDMQTSRILLLLCREGGAVSKELLIKDIWQGRPITDAAMSTAIRRLRKAISELDNSQEYIQTITKLGFKISVAVSECSEEKPTSRSVQHRRILIGGVVGFAVVTLFVLGLYTFNKFSTIENPASYHKAQFLLSQKKHELIPQAILFLEQAVIEKPDHLQSHTTLAQIYAYKLSRYLGLRDEEIISKAKQHIALAEQIDSEHPDIALSRAMLDYFYLRDLPAVRRYIQAVGGRKVCDDKCNFFIAYSLPVLGRAREAPIFAQRAHDLRPDVVTYNWELAWSRFMASEFDTALVEVEKAEKLAGKTNHIFRAMLAQAQKKPALSLYHWGEFYKDNEKLSINHHHLFTQYLDKGEYEVAANFLLSVLSNLAVDQKAELLILAGKSTEAIGVLTEPVSLQKQTYLMAAAESPVFIAYFSVEELQKIKSVVWGD